MAGAVGGLHRSMPDLIHREIAACRRALVLHLRRLPGGGLFDTYARSIEQTWGSARPVTDADTVGA
ncbi:hypothetical protein AMK14_09205 [Streptomyces sp. TSRI0445]|nr:hypothetical protein AMK14_09205 [Streptomyces sp. TSRI0445]